MSQPQHLPLEESLRPAAPAAIERKPRLVMRDPQQSVISSFELPALPGRVEREQAAYRDPGGEASRIVEQARRTAADMLEQTRSACESDREAARVAGYEAGFAQGMASADIESAGLIQTAEQIALNVAAERERLLAESESDIVELALAIGERLANAAIDVNPDYVVEVCRGAMRKAFQRETLVVRAHPEDLQVLREAGPQLAAELGGVQHLEFVEERRVARGSLIVRTPAGEIDATLDGKAEKIAEGLRELIRSRAAENRLRGT